MSMKHTDGFGSKHEHWHPGEDRAYLDRAIRRLNDTPPVPGLTRINTGVRHDVYRGWFIAFDEQRNIARRAAKRYDPPTNVTNIEEAREKRTRAETLAELKARDARRRDLPPRECTACGERFSPTTARNSRCEACRHGAERTAVCDECGVEFRYTVDAGKPLQRFCSKSHATRFNKRLRKARQLAKEVGA